jgi:hypothetical protein
MYVWVVQLMEVGWRVGLGWVPICACEYGGIEYSVHTTI